MLSCPLTPQLIREKGVETCTRKEVVKRELTFSLHRMFNTEISSLQIVEIFSLEVSMKNVLLLVDLNLEGKQNVGDMPSVRLQILYHMVTSFQGNIFCYQ